MADLTNERSLTLRYAVNGDERGKGHIVLKGREYEVRQDVVDVPFQFDDSQA